jgi:hypothetical protein
MTILTEPLICVPCNNYTKTDRSNWNRHIGSKLHHRRSTKSHKLEEKVDSWSSRNTLEGVLNGSIILTAQQTQSCLQYVMNLVQVNKISLSKYFPYEDTDITLFPNTLLHDVLSIILDYDLNEEGLTAIRSTFKTLIILD